MRQLILTLLTVGCVEQQDGSKWSDDTGDESATNTGGTEAGADTTGGTETSGDATGGTETGGDTTGGAETGGDATGGTETGGDATGGAEAGGDTTGGMETGGDTTGGAEAGGDATGGAETGGDATGGAEAGGDATGGAETGADATGGTEMGGESTGGGADPVIGAPCYTTFADTSLPPDGVFDCGLVCVQDDWAVPTAEGGLIGDGFCDDAERVYAAHFHCEEFEFDAGDCSVAVMMPDFALENFNPTSPMYGGSPVSPRDLIGTTTGWYFTHAS